MITIFNISSQRFSIKKQFIFGYLIPFEDKCQSMKSLKLLTFDPRTTVKMRLIFFFCREIEASLEIKLSI